VVAAVIVVLGVGACLTRDWLLLSVADLWIVSDPVGPADAVAVFGGGIRDRPFAAAQYYRQGLIQKILVSNERQGSAENRDSIGSGAAVTEGVLVKLGVPSSAIETFGNDLGNTRQEVLALQAWAEHNNARNIIVPTETFSTRRVRWMLHRTFGDGYVIRVIALDPPQFRRDDWWWQRQGITAFGKEILKYVYYRLSY
jgi:uncharacterized SAM-binding protein YcdF (DUF218 family)